MRIHMSLMHMSYVSVLLLENWFFNKCPARKPESLFSNNSLDTRANITLRAMAAPVPRRAFELTAEKSNTALSSSMTG